MKKHDPDLDSTLNAVLTSLQTVEQHSTDTDRRAFYAMGVIESFLGHLSESSQLTKEQRAQVAKIVTTWDQAVFGTLGIDFDTLGKTTSPQDCPTSSSESEVHA